MTGIPTPANLRLHGAVAELNRTVEAFLALGRCRQHMGEDLLSRLMLAQHEDGTRMNDRQLRDEVMTLYLAGHETTILTLTWSWYLLSQHRHVEEKLASEWQHVLAGRTPTPRDERGQASSRASVIHQRCSAALASTRRFLHRHLVHLDVVDHELACLLVHPEIRSVSSAMTGA